MEGIKALSNNAGLWFMITVSIAISIHCFIKSIDDEKDNKKNHRWFLFGALCFFISIVLSYAGCVLALFEENIASLKILYTFYSLAMISGLACLYIGHYKLKDKTEKSTAEKVEDIREEIKEEPEEKPKEEREKEPETEEKIEPEEEIKEKQIEEQVEEAKEKKEEKIEKKSKMKIGILIKQVPDTETKIELEDKSSGIKTEDIKYVISPFDEHAIEEALKLKESINEAETVVISAGPERITQAIKKAIARGVDNGIHIVDDALTSNDSFFTAKTLAKVLEQESLDIIFAGKQAVDYDNAQVPQLIAEMLGIPCVTDVSKFEFKENKVFVEREVEGGTKEKWELTTPCIIGATKGLNEPRYESLPGIAKAKNKEIKTITLADLGIDPSKMIKTEIKKFSMPPEKQAGKTVQTAKELAKLLREEAKVI